MGRFLGTLGTLAIAGFLIWQIDAWPEQILIAVAGGCAILWINQEN